MLSSCKRCFLCVHKSPSLRSYKPNAIQSMKTKWETEKAQLVEKVESANRGKADAEKDREFFREQYAKASGYVSSVRDENKDLEKRVKIAEDQTQSGLSLVKATFELRVKTLEDDLKAWRKMAEFLIEKDRRSNNDDIRRRAAEEPELRAQCERQAIALAQGEEHLNALEAELEEKTHAWNDSEVELQRWRNETTRLHVELNEAMTKLDRIGRGGDYDDESADMSGNGHEFVYSCKWRTDHNESCREVFSTISELEQHLVSAAGHLQST
ncbi:hypothetical protein BDZ97DRAFT_1281923 [Flammula alnicola]|nr:hypothetical protein BDZ97DRAFT_1281923 [Flammula alnicola]